VTFWRHNADGISFTVPSPIVFIALVQNSMEQAFVINVVPLELH